MIAPVEQRDGTKERKKEVEMMDLCLIPKAPYKGTNASRKEGSIKPTCRENLGEVPEGDCTPVRVVRVRIH